VEPSTAPPDGSTGLTLKPRSFLTIAGVMHRSEKCVLSIDMFSAVVCWSGGFGWVGFFDVLESESR
jgi:hypothetical protein